MQFHNPTSKAKRLLELDKQADAALSPLTTGKIGNQDNTVTYSIFGSSKEVTTPKQESCKENANGAENMDYVASTPQREDDREHAFIVPSTSARKQQEKQGSSPEISRNEIALLMESYRIVGFSNIDAICEYVRSHGGRSDFGKEHYEKCQALIWEKALPQVLHSSKTPPSHGIVASANSKLSLGKKTRRMEEQKKKQVTSPFLASLDTKSASTRPGSAEDDGKIVNPSPVSLGPSPISKKNKVQRTIPGSHGDDLETSQHRDHGVNDPDVNNRDELPAPPSPRTANERPSSSSHQSTPNNPTPALLLAAIHQPIPAESSLANNPIMNAEEESLLLDLGETNDGIMQVDESSGRDIQAKEQPEDLPVNWYYGCGLSPRERQDALKWCIYATRERLQENYMPPILMEEGQGEQRARVIGLETQCKELYGLVRAAIRNGESSSMILVGDKGSGKTFALEHVLRTLREEQQQQGLHFGQDEKQSVPFLKVALNGLIQTDDVMALKEITRQLSLNNVWDKMMSSKDIAQHSLGCSKGSFSQHLQFLLSVLREGSRSASATWKIVPVIFVLDEFEAFASRHKQTLLYNLLDLTQSKESHIVVIGITNRLDIVEQMEKRIKSRFDNRQFLFPVPSFEQLQTILLQRLLLCTPDGWGPEANQAIEMISQWNTSVKDLIKAHPGSTDLLKRVHALGYSVGWTLKLFAIALSRLLHKGRRSEFLQVSDLKIATERLNVDIRVQLFQGVSLTDLVLVIAMVHLEKKRDMDSYNFEIIYAESEKFYRGANQEPIKKNVAAKSLEHLIQLNLVAFRTGASQNQSGQGRGGDVPPQFKHVRLMIDPDSVIEFIRKGVINCPTSIHQWALRGD